MLKPLERLLPKTAGKRLNQRYLALRDEIDKHHIEALSLTDTDAELMLPYRVCYWTDYHSTTVLRYYPELRDTVDKINGLLVTRDELKLRRSFVTF